MRLMINVANMNKFKVQKINKMKILDPSQIMNNKINKFWVKDIMKRLTMML